MSLGGAASTARSAAGREWTLAAAAGLAAVETTAVCVGCMVLLGAAARLFPSPRMPAG